MKSPRDSLASAQSRSCGHLLTASVSAVRAASRSVESSFGDAASARHAVSASRSSTKRRSSAGNSSFAACSYNSWARRNDFSEYSRSASAFIRSYELWGIAAMIDSNRETSK